MKSAVVVTLGSESSAGVARLGYQVANRVTLPRIVAEVEIHPGELFARPGFLVTNMALPSRSLVCVYNKRGTAERSFVSEFSERLAPGEYHPCDHLLDHCRATVAGAQKES